MWLFKRGILFFNWYRFLKYLYDSHNNKNEIIADNLSDYYCTEQESSQSGSSVLEENDKFPMKLSDLEQWFRTKI